MLQWEVWLAGTGISLESHGIVILRCVRSLCNGGLRTGYNYSLIDVWRYFPCHLLMYPLPSTESSFLLLGLLDSESWSVFLFRYIDVGVISGTL
jgi:hypothetical protein